jgi:pimeloyl-ACP methyl ester carboxylesterase
MPQPEEFVAARAAHVTSEVTPDVACDQSRREFLASVTAAGVMGLASRAPASSVVVATDGAKLPAYGNGTLPAGIRSRIVSNVNGLTVHTLEAGYETPGRPAVLLLHGFPELAYSWRKVMVPLAAAGFHVIAPDVRGYGRTTGWDDAYDTDLESFSLFTLVRDALALVAAFGYRSVAAVVGHDFGSPVAAWCALIRPDVFRSVVMMSSPFAGPPELPFNTVDPPPVHRKGPEAAPVLSIDDQLAQLEPPRKYYQRYYTTRAANHDMQDAPQGLRAFLRAYYHYKSADWPGNQPFPLKARTGEELAKLPTYYVMDLNQDMAETVAPKMPTPEQISACRWLTDAELDVYVGEYKRTGFQGGLQAYRCLYDAKRLAELKLYANRTIDVPSCFIGGKSDWGPYQTPGALESMWKSACTRMEGIHFVDGAGHWVQQERADQVSTLLVQFVSSPPQVRKKS